MIAVGAAAVPAAALLDAAPVERDAAREAAQRELSKGIYHADDPGLFERLVDRAVSWLDDRLAQAAGLAPGGTLGLLALLVVLAATTALILWRTGPVRRANARGGSTLDVSALVSAAEHRQRADAFSHDGRYAEAVRERMRAIVRELEDRGVLEPRPGRTADEVAREGGTVVPAVAADLRAAARLFDEIWFGGRPATAASDAAMREADQRVRTAQLAVAVRSAVVPPGLREPR
jgi:Domain of unknown function (DUF4129)